MKDCDRVGLSVPRAQEVEKAVKQGEINLSIIDTQKELITLKDKKAEDALKEAALYKDDSVRERKETDRLRAEGSTKILIGIGLGFVGAWAAAQLIKSVNGR